jgi:hypothetical protein
MIWRRARGHEDDGVKSIQYMDDNSRVACRLGGKSGAVLVVGGKNVDENEGGQEAVNGDPRGKRGRR